VNGIEVREIQDLHSRITMTALRKVAVAQ